MRAKRRIHFCRQRSIAQPYRPPENHIEATNQNQLYFPACISFPQVSGVNRKYSLRRSANVAGASPDSTRLVNSRCFAYRSGSRLKIQRQGSEQKTYLCSPMSSVLAVLLRGVPALKGN